MLDRASKTFFHLLAGSRILAHLASRYGMRSPLELRAPLHCRRDGRRGDCCGAGGRDGLAVSRPSTTSGRAWPRSKKPTRRRAPIWAVIDAIAASGIGRNLSLKLTQLGLDVDRASAVDNLRKILARADGFFVRIDMESSRLHGCHPRYFRASLAAGLPPDRRRPSG